VVHLDEPVGGGRVPLGKSGHAGPKSTGIRVGAGTIEGTDGADEVNRMGEVIVGVVVGSSAPRGISAQGQQIGDSGPCIAPEDLVDFPGSVADARQVGNGIEGGGRFEAHDQIVRALAGRAPGPISHTDKGGPQRLELDNGLIQCLGRLGRRRRKKLKGKTRLPTPKNFSNVHARTIGPTPPVPSTQIPSTPWPMFGLDRTPVPNENHSSPEACQAGFVPLFASWGQITFQNVMNAELIAMLDYLERERGIQREALLEAITEAIISSSKKSFTSNTRDLRVEIDEKSGSIRAFAKLIATEHVTNPHDEIGLEKARRINPSAQPGDEIQVEVPPRDLGRIAAQAARQAINQRIRQIEKDMIYEEFKDRAGEIVSGTVRRFEKSDVILDLGRFEGTMPSKERVVTEEYNVGDRLRAYVVAVENGPRGAEIILSRSHPNFVRRLFEIEVSEIADRTVEMKMIAREAGHRTKVAVHSADPKVDPVGACVGMRGARVKNIVRELNNEKVDIIRWDPDPLKFAQAALKPATIKSLSLDEESHTIRVIVGKDDLSLAIGRRGQNARLTSKLTGWEVDINEDRSAEEAMESQKAQAALSLSETLGVTDEEAQMLAAGGMNSIEAILTAEAADIAEVLGCEPERAGKILESAQKSSPVESEKDV